MKLLEIFRQKKSGQDIQELKRDIGVEEKAEVQENKEWREKTSFRWDRMLPAGRQSCLIDIVDRDHLMDITGYTMKFFDQLPEEYAKALAKRWGYLK